MSEQDHPAKAGGTPPASGSVPSFCHEAQKMLADALDDLMDRLTEMEEGDLRSTQLAIMGTMDAVRVTMAVVGALVAEVLT